ncbi:MAG: acetylglutamate kinase [Phycisphaeraceae bacterium]|nr:MAG: acetylglutamate kinase [Phycisphaeraceae bacterium]
MMSPLVVKLGGAALDQPDACAPLWSAIAELHSRWRGSPSRDQQSPTGVVLVHGGGGAVDRRLARLGMTTQRREGIRLTPDDQIDEVVGALAGTVNKQIVASLNAAGVPAVGLCLADGGFAKCVKTRRYTFDPGRVGEVIGGDPKLVRTLLGAGFLPVISSIGADADGRALNINADEAAASAAALLTAGGLVLLTDVPGILDSGGALLNELTPDDVEQLIASGAIHGGMIPKARGAVDAARISGAPAVIASWKRPEDLLRIANGESVGTRILAKAHASLAEATP